MGAINCLSHICGIVHPPVTVPSHIVSTAARIRSSGSRHHSELQLPVFTGCVRIASKRSHRATATYREESKMSTALEWFKSSYSGDKGSQGLEIAHAERQIHIRDSKTPEDAPTLQLTPTVWAAFIATW